MEKAKIIEWKRHGDARGSLVAIEGTKNVPFEIKRIFYMDGMSPDTVRAKHANRNSRFVLVAVAGSCRISVDDGVNREVFSLTHNWEGLLCEPMTWKEMYGFSADCVLMVICNTVFDAEEYIDGYEDFKREAAGKGAGERA